MIELVPFTVDVAQNIGLTILQVMDRYDFRAKMYLVSAVLNVALTVLLAKSIGIVGAAAASAIAMAASSGIILNWYYAARIGLDMGAWWRSVLREIAPMLALCAVASIVWHPLAGGGWHMLLAGIGVWAAAFASVAYLLCADEYEKKLVRQVLHRLVPSK